MDDYQFSFDYPDVDLFNSYNEGSADIKFKGLQVENDTNLFELSNLRDAPEHNIHLGKELNLKPTQIKETIFSNKASPDSSNLLEIPSVLAKTHFVVENSQLEPIETKMEEFLISLEDYDFSHFPKEYMWRGKYLKGTVCCEIDIHLFEDIIAGDIIVEVKRVKGESLTPSFQDFFQQIRSMWLIEPNNKKRRCVPPFPGRKAALSDEQFLEGIQTINKMSTETYMEARVEAAKMLFEVSQKDAHYVELKECRNMCVSALEHLLMDSFEDVRQFAVMAYEKFIQISCYQEELVRCAAFPVIFHLVDNCLEGTASYETAQVRRTAAKCLADLCAILPYAVHDRLQKQQVLTGNRQCCLDSWCDKLKSLEDARTRNYAEQAQNFLQMAMDANNNSKQRKLSPDSVACKFPNNAVSSY